MVLLIEFLAMTAVRISEALSLTWGDVEDYGINIDGKGGRRRVFPRFMTGFERLEEILEDLAPYREGSGGRLFRWKNRHSVGDALRVACARLGFKEGPSAHALRKAAED